MKLSRHQPVGPENDLVPTYVPVGESAEARAAAMRELRRFSNEIPAAMHKRDELLHAYATSQSLSRRDMATACGLTEGRIQQILTELHEHDQELRNRRAKETFARHRAG
jgi:hypothetical protein